MLIFIATAVILFILGSIFYHAECMKRGNYGKYKNNENRRKQFFDDCEYDLKFNPINSNDLRNIWNGIDDD